MESAIYQGKVRHRRFSPVENVFSYGLFMMYLDLSELDQVFRERWLWSAYRPNLAYLRRKDHLGDPSQTLDSSVRDLVQQQTGRTPGGPIRLLTHLRYWGHCFNPVSFFYCFDAAGQRLEMIVAEINNTPWHERHCYVLSRSLDDTPATWCHYRLHKAFHVSPFMDMDQDYDWRFLQPGPRLQVHMQNFEQGQKRFDATLSLQRIELSGPALARVLMRYPAMTLTVVFRIYWQALTLHRKGAPFYAHPAKRKPSTEEKP